IEGSESEKPNPKKKVKKKVKSDAPEHLVTAAPSILNQEITAPVVAKDAFNFDNSRADAKKVAGFSGQSAWSEVETSVDGDENTEEGTKTTEEKANEALPKLYTDTHTSLDQAKIDKAEPWSVKVETFKNSAGKVVKTNIKIEDKEIAKLFKVNKKGKIEVVTKNGKKVTVTKEQYDNAFLSAIMQASGGKDVFESFTDDQRQLAVAHFEKEGGKTHLDRLNSMMPYLVETGAPRQGKSKLPPTLTSGKAAVTKHLAAFLKNTPVDPTIKLEGKFEEGNSQKKVIEKYVQQFVATMSEDELFTFALNLQTKNKLDMKTLYQMGRFRNRNSIKPKEKKDDKKGPLPFDKSVEKALVDPRTGKELIAGSAEEVKFQNGIATEAVARVKKLNEGIASDIQDGMAWNAGIARFDNGNGDARGRVFKSMVQLPLLENKLTETSKEIATLSQSNSNESKAAITVLQGLGDKEFNKILSAKENPARELAYSEIIGQGFADKGKKFNVGTARDILKKMVEHRMGSVTRDGMRSQQLKFAKDPDTKAIYDQMQKAHAEIKAAPADKRKGLLAAKTKFFTDEAFATSNENGQLAKQFKIKDRIEELASKGFSENSLKNRQKAAENKISTLVKSYERLQNGGDKSELKSVTDKLKNDYFLQHSRHKVCLCHHLVLNIFANHQILALP
ncbi:hypothetical protein BVY03_05410, partial [bacterium K02(2017)]